MSPGESIGSSDPSVQHLEIEIDYSKTCKVEVVDFETAINYSGYGKFQFLLLCVCGLVYATCAISTTTLSFVLSSAKCEFLLSSSDKGKLSAMPLIGMAFGCGLWSIIADIQGRKKAIIISLSIDFFAAILSSTVESFNTFLICRFFNGFGIIGAISIIFSYLGEFLSNKHRDILLGRLEIFWNVGIIILPGFAWLILNKSMTEIFAEHEFVQPWRIFVLLCSIPSLLSIVAMFFFPETPKYLLHKKQFKKARQVFQQIFEINTGLPKRFYPAVTLEGEYEDINENEIAKIPIVQNQLWFKLTSIIELCKSACQQPILKYLGIVCFVDFGLMTSYYTLLMWIPEIFDRFSQFEQLYPNETSSVCSVSTSIKYHQQFETEQTCDSSINNQVFLDTIIVGLSCIPASLSLSYFMEKFGKKIVLIFGLLLSGLITLLFNLVQNSSETLAFSCAFESLTSILETVLFCVVVDIFPINLRALSMAAIVISGRLGAIFGNIIFGSLIDLYCFVPIYLFGMLLIVSGVLCLMLPQGTGYTFLV